MKEKFNKIIKVLLVVSVVFLFTISFLLSNQGQRDAHFWISIGALLLCIVVTFGYSLFTLNRGGSKVPVPAVLSVDTLISIYGIIVIADILIFWATFRTLWMVYLAIHLISLFIFIIIGGLLIMFNISASAKIKETSYHTNRINEVKITIDDIRNSMKALKDMEDYKAACDKIDELYDKVRYSDPISHNGTAGIELEIKDEINKLKEKIGELAVGEGELSLVDSINYINSIIDMVGRRNKVLSTLK